MSRKSEKVTLFRCINLMCVVPAIRHDKLVTVFRVRKPRENDVRNFHMWANQVQLSHNCRNWEYCHFLQGKLFPVFFS